MTEEAKKDVIWPIGLTLSAALHVGGLCYLISHAKAPGATTVPTPAISVSLTPTKVFDTMNDTGAVEDASRNLTGDGGQETQTTEQMPPEETQPDPEEEARLAAETEARERGKAEAREKAEADARALAEAGEKAEAEAWARAEANARDRAVTEAKAREKAKTEARARAEQEAKALAEAREKAEAEARAKAEAEARAKADADERERAEAERRKLAEAKRRKETEEKERERRAEAEKHRQQRQTRRAGSAASGESEAANRSQAGRLSASTGQIIDYKAKIKAHLARLRVSAGKHGKYSLSVSFYLSENGSVAWAKITRSSGISLLDQAVIAAIYRLAPFPKPPTGTKPKDREIRSPITIAVK